MKTPDLKKEIKFPSKNMLKVMKEAGKEWYPLKKGSVTLRELYMYELGYEEGKITAQKEIDYQKEASYSEYHRNDGEDKNA